MWKWLLALGVVVAGYAFLLSSREPVDPASLAVDDGQGQELFEANCAACHGVGATGTDKAPSLIQKIYAPRLHGDEAFQVAVALGVRQHHSRAGSMLKLEGVPREDVDKIIIYVRQLQREAGIN